jgi:hypothetical protein
MRTRPAYHLPRVTAAISLVLVSAPAFAGAWLQPQGKGQIILNNFYYTADTFFNNQGQRQSQSEYHKYELNPYIEFGWSDQLTLGANLSVQRTSQNTTSNYGLGDSEFFGRLRLWQKDNFVLSVSPLVKLPALDNSSDRPKIGSSHPDAGLGLAAGYGFDAYGQHHFTDISALYRYRFGDPENQVNITATLGLGLSERWMLMPQVFATYRTDKPDVAAFTQSSGDDYNLVKLQLSAVYKLNDKTSLQFGGFADVDGNNTGVGRGILFSLWRNF